MSLGRVSNAECSGVIAATFNINLSKQKQGHILWCHDTQENDTHHNGIMTYHMNDNQHNAYQN